MLLYLHVKNYALIDDVEVEFSDGLNIITGETGAGKSVLLGSINLALGAKSKTDVIREGEESAFVELHFSIENEAQRAVLSELEIDAPDDVAVIYRKVSKQRSVGKICGVTVSTADLKKVADTFLDVYGQHDYQNLLKESMHIEILDEYAGEEVKVLKEEVFKNYISYSSAKKELDSLEEDAEKRARDLDFLKFQLEEIENAALKRGEEEELKEYLHLAENAEKVATALGKTGVMISEEEGALGRLSYAFRELSYVSGLTPEIDSFEEGLRQAQDILQQTNRSMKDYLDSLEFDEETLEQSRRRYDEISTILMKYGKTVDAVEAFYEKKSAEYEKLASFEEYKANLSEKVRESETELKDACEKLSALRKEEAKRMAEEIRKALSDLNFADSRFEIRFEENDHYTPKGTDLAKFYISTNVGEPERPLCDVASGGELSRIMLAIKTVCAGKDLVPTLIFDEIDAGISGTTAWKVSEKLGLLSRNLQVICITHLPQIAAMADTHFEIKKVEEAGHTVTKVKRLMQYESVAELTRLLGGSGKQDAAKENAKELLALAKKLKKS